MSLCSLWISVVYVMDTFQFLDSRFCIPFKCIFQLSTPIWITVYDYMLMLSRAFIRFNFWFGHDNILAKTITKISPFFFVDNTLWKKTLIHVCDQNLDIGSRVIVRYRPRNSLFYKQCSYHVFVYINCIVVKPSSKSYTFYLLVNFAYK